MSENTSDATDLNTTIGLCERLAASAARDHSKLDCSSVETIKQVVARQLCNTWDQSGFHHLHGSLEHMVNSVVAAAVRAAENEINQQLAGAFTSKLADVVRVVPLP